jgi:hypothetical protein
MEVDPAGDQMILLVEESRVALGSARAALDHYGGRFWLGNPTKVEGEFYELGLLEESERFMALDIALKEITVDDRCGPNPPDDYSSHGPFRGCKLYAFKWQSSHFEKPIYFKFGLPVDCGKPRLAVYSFHEPRY